MFRPIWTKTYTGRLPVAFGSEAKKYTSHRMPNTRMLRMFSRAQAVIRIWGSSLSRPLFS